MKESDYYDKKIDNELKKRDLEIKFGAKFSKSSNISPEIESEWLNQIEQYEKQCNNAKSITVWQYLDKPAFKKVDELTSNELADEYERLLKLMENNNVVLETLCKVDKIELYRFITEELFFHEMDNIRIKGMTTHFTYEEFHPNAENDIEHAYDYFFRMTMAKMKDMEGHEYDLLYIDTNNYQDIYGKKVECMQVRNKINNFLNSFDYFEITTNKIQKISINDDKTDAEIIFNIDYLGRFDNSSETINYKGKGTFRLRPSVYGGWEVYHINMPGLQI